MIAKLWIAKEETARQVLAVQIPAYEVEAELIQFHDLPPLKETIGSLTACGESFYGFFEQGELAGVISYKKEDDTVDIHRLIVHPAYFRRGIAQALLRFVERLEQSAAKFVVATAARNNPAKNLYLKNGFLQVKEQEVAPGLSLSFFEKRKL
ncbi:GNAT family N-acetyltransferase [Paenibacillus beijingensis]|uniref:Acetyltransferase n=1 Tax=Paenibacillus beijingensis TaxID=1126833 RepID=A0A0D5NFB4_9BACL|nr:GNAT family N-acetyltransferase [Paenibacillus beijingensis]AJY73946.1 acetyltransferase [Paenibacillus beijingensis]